MKYIIISVSGYFPLKGSIIYTSKKKAHTYIPQGHREWKSLCWYFNTNCFLHF